VGLLVPKEPIRTLIAALSGVPVSRVYWDGEPEKHIGPISGKAGKITLNVPARAENGTIEPRRTYTGGPTPTQTTEWGKHETMTLSIRADNFIGHGEAFDTLEKVRFRLGLPSSRAALRAADLAFVDAPLLVTRGTMVVDTRVVSSSVMDVRLAQVVSEVPEGQDGNEGWIEKVSSASGPFDPDAPVYDLEGDFDP
jgi:hypothetical protein